MNTEKGHRSLIKYIGTTSNNSH